MKMTLKRFISFTENASFIKFIKQFFTPITSLRMFLKIGRNGG